MPNIHDSFPSRYLKCQDLKGKKLKVTIESVELEKVTKDKDEQPVLYFKNQNKGLVLNKTNGLAAEEVLGTGETDDWPGGKLVLVPTRVDFQGKRVPAIRIEIPENGKNSGGPPDDDVPFGDDDD